MVPALLLFKHPLGSILASATNVINRKTGTRTRTGTQTKVELCVATARSRELVECRNVFVSQVKHLELRGGLWRPWQRRSELGGTFWGAGSVVPDGGVDILIAAAAVAARTTAVHAVAGTVSFGTALKTTSPHAAVFVLRPWTASVDVITEHVAHLVRRRCPPPPLLVAVWNPTATF